MSRTLAVVIAALVVALSPGFDAAGAAPPPAPAGAVVDAFTYADDAAARAAWRPMGDTAGVRVIQVDGRPALAMPCNFRGTKIDRASWDKAVTLDMTACRGLTFRFRATGPLSVSGFSLYLQSGGGWYAATFAPERRDGWSAITIRKEDTRMEGTPAGWGQISTIRISAWRGGDADTEFQISDLALVGGAARMAVVRGESAARTAPGQVDSACQFAGEMAQFLEALGLEYTMVSDLDLVPGRLTNLRVVILPHNPAMPDAAADALAAWAGGGGKVMAFYSLHPKLAEAMGITPAGHIREKRPGQFATIRFREPLAPGMPATVGQKSWNIVEVRPIEGRSRVAAQWFDADGKDTGYAAVLESDRGTYMSHVILTDDLAGKRRMLLAMIGRLMPEAWAAAAQARIAGVSRLVSGGEAEQTADSQAVAKARAEAVRRAVAARDLGDKGKFIEAMQAADEARRAFVEAWCAAQPAKPGERRAFWCHSAFGPAGMTWDESIRVLAENGFTAILPNMSWGGTAFYESRILPVAPEVKDRGDQVALCVAACRRYGVECHVWRVNWNTGGRAPREFIDRMRRDGRMQVRFNGKPDGEWLCPSHPENRRLEIDAMVEVATKYDVDGVHFDYIRYPDRDGCFCPGCRERFEKAAGVKVADWPGDVRKDAALEAKWLDFRRDQITQVVAGVSEAVRKQRPKVKVSAAVFPNWPVDRDSIGQDWKLWCDRGYLDFVCPMDYTRHAAEFENQVTQQRAWAGKVPVWPGIGLSVWPSAGDVGRLLDFMAITRRLGTAGFTIFEYRASEAREVLPLVGKGATRKTP